MFRSLRLSVRHRARAMAMALLAIVLGGAFIAFGLLLLISVLAAATVLGSALAIYRRLTGRWPRFFRRGTARPELDPTNEVFPSPTTGGDAGSRLPPPA